MQNSLLFLIQNKQYKDIEMAIDSKIELSNSHIELILLQRQSYLITKYLLNTNKTLTKSSWNFYSKLVSSEEIQILLQSNYKLSEKEEKSLFLKTIFSNQPLEKKFTQKYNNEIKDLILKTLKNHSKISFILEKLPSLYDFLSEKYFDKFSKIYDVLYYNQIHFSNDELEQIINLTKKINIFYYGEKFNQLDNFNQILLSEKIESSKVDLKSHLIYKSKISLIDIEKLPLSFQKMIDDILQKYSKIIASNSDIDFLIDKKLPEVIKIYNEIDKTLEMSKNPDKLFCEAINNINQILDNKILEQENNKILQLSKKIKLL